MLCCYNQSHLNAHDIRKHRAHCWHAAVTSGWSPALAIWEKETPALHEFDNSSVSSVHIWQLPVWCYHVLLLLSVCNLPACWISGVLCTNPFSPCHPVSPLRFGRSIKLQTPTNRLMNLITVQGVLCAFGSFLSVLPAGYLEPFVQIHLVLAIL